MDSVIIASLKASYGDVPQRFPQKFLVDLKDVVDGDEMDWVKERELSSLIWCQLGGSSRIADRAAQTILLGRTADLAMS